MCEKIYDYLRKHDYLTWSKYTLTHRDCGDRDPALCLNEQVYEQAAGHKNTVFALDVRGMDPDHLNFLLPILSRDDGMIESEVKVSFFYYFH